MSFVSVSVFLHSHATFAFVRLSLDVEGAICIVVSLADASLVLCAHTNTHCPGSSAPPGAAGSEIPRTKQRNAAMMNTDWLLICKTVGPLTAKNADANV